MKYIIVGLLFLTGCNYTPKYFYQDKVKVVNGFYKNCEGDVKAETGILKLNVEIESLICNEHWIGTTIIVDKLNIRKINE